MRTCFEINLAGFPIVLKQQARNKFTVVYGKQTKPGLTYSAAAAELGSCVMHALACDDRLDNRMPGEQ